MSEKSKHVSRKRKRTAAAFQKVIEAKWAPPFWVRAPTKGPEYWSGFSRSKLYELAKDGKIQSKSIREPGQHKGTRLFNLRSIFAFIEAQPDAAQEAA